MMSDIDRIRRAIREGKYGFTDHAVEEVQNDGLLLAEVIDVLLYGEIDSIYTEDKRGTRYVVRGDVADLEVDVVCRFDLDGTLLIIITIYVVD
jgi:hypothetical protein